MKVDITFKIQKTQDIVRDSHNNNIKEHNYLLNIFETQTVSFTYSIILPTKEQSINCTINCFQ